MLQLRKKSKLYTQLDLVKLGHFKIYIRSFVDYQHLQKYFYNWNITWNYCFLCKINFRDKFIWKYSDSIKCWYFDTIILPFLKKVKRFKTRKIDPPFSEIFIHTTVGLIEKGLSFPGKNLGFWFQFAWFGSS